ncbi:hypothetical protein NQ314_017115 [Rhamnusium bicolor]|uniref:Uncharacterized protein n=1 Tax=Rhamnusium bicolor TaxID=1586634 RepID=A0AAV8WU36_9CUCU|nr:hypothetical protein NQ314_017115 [Rhamnusium bicolor]
MQPRTAEQYIGHMDEVANELIENMKYFSMNDKNNEMPEDFQNELYKWTLESIGAISLDRRLGGHVNYLRRYYCQAKRHVIVTKLSTFN